MKNKTKITLTLLILLGFGALNTSAQDEPYMEIAGHTGWVNSVAFSPDGNIIASGSGTQFGNDSTIRLWDTSTGELLKTLEGHPWGVNSVAFHPEGNTLATGGDDNTIKLWDTNTGELLKTLEGHTHDVSSVAFSSDGNTLATGSWDATIRLWDAKTGELLKTLEIQWGQVSSVAFHPEGNTLATGRRGGTVRLWDAKTGELLKTLKGHTDWGHTDWVNSVAFHPDGNTLATGSADNTIKLWDANTGELLKTLKGHPWGVNSVAFHPDGNTLATGGDDNTIKLWDTKTGENIRTLEGHTDAAGYIVVVRSVAFHPDGNTLASGNNNNTIKLWHVDTGGATPNLPITTVSLSESDIKGTPGKAFQLSATLENTGAIAPPSMLQFYGPVKVENTGTDGTLPTIDFTGKTLGEPITVAAMDDDSIRNKTITATAPETAGTYAYKACIQRVGAAGGTDEICSDVFTVTVVQPDLQFAKVWAFPATVAPGKEFKLSATVSNPGGNSDSTMLRWSYKGHGDNPPTTYEELKAIRIVPLPLADGKTKVTYAITVTAPETPGTYYYKTAIDKVEGEIDIRNNSNHSDPIKVTVGQPNLVIKSITASQITLTPGNVFNLYATVQNLGDSPSDKTTINYYRSTNDIISTDDKLIAKDLPVASIDPGETLKIPVPKEIKAPEMPGIYYYGACLKRGVREITADTTCSSGVKVTVSGPISLMPSENLVSEVAFGPNLTYFILHPQFPVITRADSDSAVNKKCTIRVDIPGVRNEPLGLWEVPNETPNRNDYWMFPVESEKWATSGVGGQQIVAGVGKTSEKIAKEALDEKLKTRTKVLAKVAQGLGVAWDVWNTIEDVKAHLATLTDPEIEIEEGKEYYSFLFLVTGQIRNVDFEMELTYELESEQGGLNPLSRPQRYKVNYEGRWNLEEIWRMEQMTKSREVSAAPHAQPMSLADYLPFQQLSPEVQEYLLRYFEETAPFKILDPEAWEIPEETALLTNYPNPFNPETWIPYQLAAAADVTLTIYDIHGHVVRALDLGHQPMGIYQSRARAAYWDGRNAQGEPVASGVYFYTLTAGDFNATRKMLIRK